MSSTAEKGLSWQLDGPSYLHIALTNKCNLFCRHCWPKHSKQVAESVASKVKEMPLSLLDKLVREARETGTVNQVTFSPIGEDAMSENILYAVSQFSAFVPRVTMFSNGTSLDTELIDRLEQAGLAGFNVSIEGTDKSSYEYIRRGAKFETFMANLRHMASKGLVTGLYSTMMRHNLEQLLRLPALAAELGIPYVNYSLLKGPDLLQDEGLGIPSYAEFQAFVRKSLEELDRLGVGSNLRALAGVYDDALYAGGFINLGAYQETYCTSPFSMMVINQMGEWKPCCSDSQFFKPYSLAERSLAEVFNSPIMLGLRRAIMNGSYPELCRNHTCGKGECAPIDPTSPMAMDLMLRNPVLKARFNDQARAAAKGGRAAVYCASNFTGGLLDKGFFADVEVRRIADRDPAKAGDFAKEHGLAPAAGGDGLDATAVFVCSPRHEDEIVARLERELPAGTAVVPVAKTLLRQARELAAEL